MACCRNWLSSKTSWEIFQILKKYLTLSNLSHLVEKLVLHLESCDCVLQHLLLLVRLGLGPNWNLLHVAKVAGAAAASICCWVK